MGSQGILWNLPRYLGLCSSGPFLQRLPGPRAQLVPGALIPVPSSASACPPRDLGPPGGQPTPAVEAQRGKRRRPLQVLTGPSGREETCRPGLYLPCSGLGAWGKSSLLSTSQGQMAGLEGANRFCGPVFQKGGQRQPQSDPLLWPCTGQPRESGPEEAPPFSQWLHLS